MPQKKKKSAKRRASSKKKQIKLFGRTWSTRSMLIFALLFALVGGYVVWRSFAFNGIVFTAQNFDAKNSVNAAVITETTTNTKRNTKVVQVVTAPGALGSAAVLDNAKVLLPTGVFKVCLYAYAPSSPVTGLVQIRTATNGALSTLLAQGNFTLNNLPDYTLATCFNLINRTPNAQVAAEVVNETNNLLRVGHVSFTHTGDLPPPPPPSVGIAPPTSFATDCSSDVSYLNTFGAWLNSLPDNSVVSLPAGACYLINNEIDIADKNGLTIHGNGATFLRTKSVTPGPHVNGRMIQFLRSNNITIEGIKIRGPKDVCTPYVEALESQHGLAFDWSSNINVYNNDIQNTSADGIYISGGGQNINIHDNVLNQLGRQGIAFTGGTNVQFTNNVVSYAHRESIDGEILGSTPASQVTITGNTLEAPHLGYINVTEGPNLHGLTVANNIQSVTSTFAGCPNK